MPQISAAALLPILLLLASNLFMTFAWYGHLAFKSKPLWIVILASWGIAFFEYCLAVPANRLGSSIYSTAELKTIQEVLTFIVFIGFSIFYLREHISVQHVIGFGIMILGATVVFRA
jgi:uncharacterized protein